MVLDLRKEFFRDTWVEINLDYLYENVTRMKQHLAADTSIIAVVKANAYGHGDLQVAQTALEAGATMLAVAFLDEAVALRKQGLKAPVLVLGATRPEDARIAAELDICLTATSKEWLCEVEHHVTSNSPLSIHVKCDTGMGRIGIRSIEELLEVVEILRDSECFVFNGVFTHYATADELDTQYFKYQLEKFEEMLNSLPVRPPFIHSSNSAASLMHPSSHFNSVRIGIAMYGLTPSLEIKDHLPIPLKQSFSLHCRLVQVKEVEAGEKISYGATYEASDREWIGTLPIGYADGWLRRLQGQEVLIEGRRMPIVGRICMDQCMIRLPHKVEVGTRVTLIGQQLDQSILIDEIAKHLETINYEIPCIISNRVPRVYVRNGKYQSVENNIMSLWK